MDGHEWIGPVVMSRARAGGRCPFGETVTLDSPWYDRTAPNWYLQAGPGVCRDENGVGGPDEAGVGTSI